MSKSHERTKGATDHAGATHSSKRSARGPTSTVARTMAADAGGLQAPGLGLAANLPLQATMALALQRSHGNAFVQRLMEAGERGDPRREPESELLERIGSTRGGGGRLDGSTRKDMESTFGRDFSDVRIHTDSTADRLSRDLSARAFTVGSDVFFRSGAYSPSSSAGRETLAHELTHVAQNRARTASTRAISSPSDASEVEATSAARHATQGIAARVSATPSGIVGRIDETGTEAPTPEREGHSIWLLGEEFYRQGQYRQAIVLFERAINTRDFPLGGLANALFSMARTNFRLERWEAASLYYEQALSGPGLSAENIAVANERLAQSRASSGVTTVPEGDPEAGDTEAPPSVDARELFEQARAAYRSRDYETAINLFERARMAPANSERVRASMLNSLGWCNLRLRRFVTAKAYFGECINLGHFRYTAQRGLEQAHEGFMRDAAGIMEREGDQRPPRPAVASASAARRRPEPLPNNDIREALLRLARIVVPMPLQLPGGQTVFIPRGIMGNRLRMAYSEEGYRAGWSEAGGTGTPPRWGFHEYGEDGAQLRTWLNLSDQASPAALAGTAARVQRMVEPGEAGVVAGNEAALLSRIESARLGGRRLDERSRVEMEGAFDRDFSGVRIHTDSIADRLSRELAARAFTVGSDVFFREGAYASSSNAGRETLAHELAHVVQNASNVPRTDRLVSHPTDPSEQAAVLNRDHGVPSRSEMAPRPNLVSRQATSGEAEMSVWVSPVPENDVPSLEHAWCEDLFQLYMTTGERHTVARTNATYSAAWVRADGEELIRNVLRRKLEQKRLEGRVETLIYYRNLVNRSRGRRPQRDWLIRCIEHQIRLGNERRYAVDALPWQGDAALFPVVQRELPSDTWSPLDNHIFARFYRLVPQLRGDADPRVVFYIAHNDRVRRNEFAVSPRSLNNFLSREWLYVAAAGNFFPFVGDPALYRVTSQQVGYRILNGDLRGGMRALGDSWLEALQDPGWWLDAVDASLGGVANTPSSGGRPRPRAADSPPPAGGAHAEPAATRRSVVERPANAAGSESASPELENPPSVVVGRVIVVGDESALPSTTPRRGSAESSGTGSATDGSNGPVASDDIGFARTGVDERSPVRTSDQTLPRQAQPHVGSAIVQPRTVEPVDAAAVWTASIAQPESLNLVSRRGDFARQWEASGGTGEPPMAFWRRNHRGEPELAVDRSRLVREHPADAERIASNVFAANLVRIGGPPRRTPQVDPENLASVPANRIFLMNDEARHAAGWHATADGEAPPIVYRPDESSDQVRVNLPRLQREHPDIAARVMEASAPRQIGGRELLAAWQQNPDALILHYEFAHRRAWEAGGHTDDPPVAYYDPHDGRIRVDVEQLEAEVPALARQFGVSSGVRSPMYLAGLRRIHEERIVFYHATNKAVARLLRLMRTGRIPWNPDLGKLWITADRSAPWLSGRQVGMERTRRLYEAYGIPFDAEAQALASQRALFTVDIEQLPQTDGVRSRIEDVGRYGVGQTGRGDFQIVDLSESPIDAMTEITPFSRGEGE